MAGRPKDPNTDFKVILHVHRSYRYAATVPYEPDPKKPGKMRRRYVFWGSVTDDLHFIPNQRYLFATSEERDRLIFPKEWDMSEAEHKLAKESSHVECPSDGNEKTYTAFEEAIETVPAEEQFRNKFYGGPWLLWQIARQRGLIDDLKAVFPHSRTMQRDILTLAMYPILSRWKYNHTARWQRYTKVPSTRSLNPSVITRLSQSITDDNRMNLLKRRIARQNASTVVACDSTTRSAYGKHLADIRWGNNKDNKELPNTLEVVVYSVDSFEPIYYRSFGGNENDQRTLRTIVSDLEALGCKDLVVIFDRGYESDENMAEMARKHMPFLVCGKTGQKPVSDFLSLIQYNSAGAPINMKHSSKEDVWCAQFEYVPKPGEMTGWPEGEALKINLFLDTHIRLSEVTKMMDEIEKEKAELEHLTGKPVSIDEFNILKNDFHWHKLTRNSESGNIGYELNQKRVDKTMLSAGFFSSVAHGIDADAQGMMDLYATRDVQEKYFEEMKNQLGFSMQRNSTEDGKTGRLFILFIGLILHTWIRHIWSTKLREKYGCSKDVIDEMTSIRYIEYPDKDDHITAFTTPQAEICEAFSLTPPEGTLSKHQKEVIARKKAGRKPGRPKGSINKKTMA